jgi:hypothetical protein
MASLGFNWAGAVLTLDSNEVSELATTEDIATSLLGFGAFSGPLAPGFAAVALYIQVNRQIMQAIDRGNGVYLTLPWPAMYVGQWWLIIPTPR